MKLSIGISPCPNDTFMFGSVALGHLKIPSVETSFFYHDIEKLNRMALEGIYDVTKMSFATWLSVRGTYRLLKVGAALGKNCGPLLISQHSSYPAEHSTIALPGVHTTANLLYRLWEEEATQRTYHPYNEIMDLVDSKECDYGVIIHESRFLAKERGFHVICDLGQWWEKTTKLPIPLGCLGVKQCLEQNTVKHIEQALMKSISFAYSHRDIIMDYIKEHASEIDETVMNKHIETFVNEQSISLDQEALKAIEVLEELAEKKGFINYRSKNG